MSFDLAFLRKKLNDPALPVYVFETIDSTNTECRRRLAAGETRCLALGETQTAGKGRRGRRFYSPAGAGLYMSLLFRPADSPADSVGITTCAAVRTAEAIEALTGRDCGIKWVNDLYLDGKKVCGILTEAVGDAVIVGIGVNLTPAAVPPELADIMGCLHAPGIRDALAAEIANALLDYVPGDTSYMAEYRRRSIVIGRRVRFGEREGVAAAVEDDGGLTVETAEGRVTLRSGEISLTGIEGFF